MALFLNCRPSEKEGGSCKPMRPERPNVYPSKDPSQQPEFESLAKTNLYILQPKVDADFFHPNVTHEIFNDKKHLLFRGTLKKKFLSKVNHKHQKISISNLKKTKIVSVDFDEDKLSSMSHHEAIISCPPDTPRGRVVKYGGKFEPPSFEILSLGDGKQILFTMENSQAKTTFHQYANSSISTTLDYTILKGNRHKVAQVTSKSGLNFMLHTKDTLSPLEKAMLLGLIIAMDVLKQGKSARKENEYEFN